MPTLDCKIEGEDITIFYDVYGAQSDQVQSNTGSTETHEPKKDDASQNEDPSLTITALGQNPPDMRGGGNESSSTLHPSEVRRGPTAHVLDPMPRCLLIIAGLGARGRTEFFQHIVAHFASLSDARDDNIVSVCTLDSRGIGQSTVPHKLGQYTTRLMAKDVIALLDHLGWKRTHIVGLSLGGMVACKLAAMQPDRVASLSLIATTSSGWHMLAGISSQPFSAYLAGSGPLKWKIPANLKYNFSEEYLREVVDGGRTRMEVLIENTHKAIDEKDSGKFLAENQSSRGRKGHLAAVFKHRMHEWELKAIREANFPCQLIVGRHDRLARSYFVSRLAKELRSTLLVVEAGHAGILIEAPQAIIPALETFILGNAQTDILHINHMRSQTDEQVLQDRLFAKEFLSSFAPGRVSFKRAPSGDSTASGKPAAKDYGRSKSAAV